MHIDPPVWETDQYMPATWRVLGELLREQSLSQSDLRERTGLSHPVVVQQVAQLRRAGLIRLGRPVSGKPGRPRIPITFNWDYCRLLAAEVHKHGVTIQTTNLSGNPLGEARLLPLPEWSQSAIRQTLLDGLRRAMSAPGPRWAAVGVVMPGAIARDGMTVTSCLGICDWREQHLGEELTAELGLPVILQNEADALARAVWAERPEQVHRLIAVSLRHDDHVTSAVIDEGHLMRGNTNGTADFNGGLGHLPVEGNTRQCECGHVGCLETLLRDGRTDPTVREQAMTAMARFISGMVTTFRPDVFAIQGDTQWSEHDMRIIKDALRAYCPPVVLRSVQVLDCPSRPQESLMGAVNLQASRVLRLRKGELLEWVDAMLS